MISLLSRISTLSPYSRLLPDCRVCHRRRIKCDRSLPTCKKCAKKNISCPGYGLTLKWNQGVASRGNPAGLSVPLLPQKKVSLPSGPRSRSYKKAQGHLGSENSTQNQDKARIALHRLDKRRQSKRCEAEPFSRYWNVMALDQRLATVAQYPLMPPPHSFSSPVLESPNVRFLHHYNHVVAANMAWAGSSGNP